ncbi:MAG TPA: hypothetical protein VG939_22420 [Caulobacteraceae bacterium]|nr:hypothetical protein [Caulobacteraceae bacterium]
MRRIPALILALMALVNLVRGGVHAFAPDGGAHSIAGLDLAAGSQTILSLFATLGVGQIVRGLAQAYVLARRRDLVALFLAIQAADTLAAMAALYLWRPLPVTVPGQPANLALLAVQLAALGVAWRWPAQARA